MVPEKDLRVLYLDLKASGNGEPQWMKREHMRSQSLSPQ